MVTSSSTCAEHSVIRSILPSPAAAVRLSAERSAEVPMSLAPAAREADCPAAVLQDVGLRAAVLRGVTLMAVAPGPALSTGGSCAPFSCAACSLAARMGHV